MNNEDGNKFRELLTAIAENYGEGFSEVKAKLWWNVLKPYPLEDVERAVYAHIVCPDAGMFSPKPANIIKNITGTAQERVENVENNAEMAWTIVYGMISTVGPYRPLELDDKLAIAAVKAIGGWKKLCESTEQELVWLKKEFIDNYGIYSTTQLEHLPKQLPGIFEIEQDKKQTSKNLNKLLGEAAKKLT